MPLSIVFTNPGTYTIDDDGIRGNNTSVIRDSTGAVITTFVHPADSLTFSTITAGVTLIFNVADSFGSANVTVGSLTSAAASPDSIVVNEMRTNGFATLVSNGSITEFGADVTPDVIAAAVVFSAATGVGTFVNAIETQTTFLEAETNTGGINIANLGQVQIGGITSSVEGLFVGNSGDIKFTNNGFIYLSDTSGASVIHGADISGDVTLTAIGYDSDIYSPINAKVVRAPGGGVTLDAGRDVLLGIGGTNYDNDILATRSINIHAGRDFIMDGTSDIRTGAFGGVVGGDIVIQAGRNISLTNTTGGLQTIQAFAGDVILMTGQGGAYLSNAAFPGAVSTTDDVLLVADVVSILSGGFNTTGIGQVEIRPATAGRPIDIGSVPDIFGTLSISDAEMDLLFTLNVVIGDANSGNVEFSAPITPFIVDNLTVRSAGEILVRSSITLPRTISLFAGDDIFFTAAGSFSSSSGGFNAFVDRSQDDGGLGGIAAFAGTITVAGAITISGNGDNDALGGTAGSDTLLGFAGNDTLRGFGGSDSLDGGTGADFMFGGQGNDFYIVDNGGDQVTEAVGEGSDIVFTAVSYALAAGSAVESLGVLIPSGTAPIDLTGNEFANLLDGNAGPNVLDGGGGADDLFGEGGNDFYFVDNGGDRVFESAGNGNDIVVTTVSYALLAGQEVESLGTVNPAGTTAIDLTGNEFANRLIGNAGSNGLNGGGGADDLFGNGGNDFYVVDNVGDRVFEAAGEGFDIVFATTSYALLAGQAVESLGTLNPAGTGAFTLIGNELANRIVGNAGANFINGGAGADQLFGDAGADEFGFTTALGGGNVDLLGDFNSAADTIDLSSAVFVGLGLGPLNPNFFRIGTSADADDRIIYDSATGQIFFDSDAAGPGAQILFATVAPGTIINASDFQVI